MASIIMSFVCFYTVIFMKLGFLAQIVLKGTLIYFEECPFIWVCLMFPHNQSQIMIDLKIQLYTLSIL